MAGGFCVAALKIIIKYGKLQLKIKFTGKNEKK